MTKLTAGLPDDVVERILRGNAIDLLGLDHVG
jgi:predicted TIM-barrel fold metal-dependent hydrolase